MPKNKIDVLEIGRRVKARKHRRFAADDEFDELPPVAESDAESAAPAEAVVVTERVESCLEELKARVDDISDADERASVATVVEDLCAELHCDAGATAEGDDEEDDEDEDEDETESEDEDDADEDDEDDDALFNFGSAADSESAPAGDGDALTVGFEFDSLAPKNDSDGDDRLSRI